MGKVVVTKTISMGLEDVQLIEKLAEELRKSQSAVVREAIKAYANSLGVKLEV